MPKKLTKKPTTKLISNQQILDAIYKLTNELQEQNRLTRLDMAGNFSVLQKNLHKEMILLEWKVVNQEYLDEKLLNLKGDLMALAQKDNKKPAAIVHWLQEKKILDTQEAESILATS